MFRCHSYSYDLWVYLSRIFLDFIILGRWRFTLDLFGRVFVDDVGLEPGSIISELGGFPIKEAKFRREMDKLRNSRTTDLTLSKIERDRNQLIVQVIKIVAEAW